MSEIRLNLIDFTSTLSGTIHGSVGDQCVAALSAEPETIDELQAALHRFNRDPFSLREVLSLTIEIDDQPYDAGIMVIDMSARIVVCNSTYSQPGPDGDINYHDGCLTDIPICYVLPDDWQFLDSIETYKCIVDESRARRSSPLDAREILYGRPLLNFLATSLRLASATYCTPPTEVGKPDQPVLSPIGLIHAQWLLTPRGDLRGKSPREILLAQRRFIGTDLETRALQWTMQLEGPPCLSRYSYAFRYAGFGYHEGVIYYELIRYLLNMMIGSVKSTDDFETLVTELENLKTQWLNEPNPEFDGRTPIILVDNERQRLPEAMGGRSMVIDEDCPICKSMGDDCEAGLDVCFWYLDGSQMDEHFAFSDSATEQEYIEDRLKMELRDLKVDRQRA
jgi:hypothetical protein